MAKLADAPDAAGTWSSDASIAYAILRLTFGVNIGLRGLTRLQAEQIIIDAVASDSRLDANDMNSILAHKRQKLHRDGVLEYVETPVDLSEIGGLNCLKQWLKHRQNALSDEAVAFGLTPPRGVLLLGVQGAGKSLSAKAIATAWQRVRSRSPRSAVS